MSWKQSPIGNHIRKVDSWNPLKCTIESDFYYIDLSSIDKDKKEIVLDNVPYISTSNAPSRARQLVEKDDILVSTVRPNLNGIAIVPSLLNGATASTGYCVLRTNNKTLDANYLFYWCQSDAFITDMIA